MTDEPKIVGKAFIHSYHVRNKFHGAVVVKEKIKYEDGTVKPNIAIYDNPKRSFYITAARHRRYAFKPEYELLSKLDKYTCYDHELQTKLAEVLGLGPGWHRPATLFKSPYVFGADIGIESLIKMRYADAYPKSGLTPTVGFFDIETSIETGQIIIISYMHDSVVHTAILESFLFEEIGDKRIPVNRDDMLSHIKTTLESRTMGLNLTYNLEICDSEIKLIAWIYKQVHASGTDYIQIWNMNFDIPKVIATIEDHKLDPVIFFADPKIPEKLRYFKYYADDKRKVAHFTLKWPFLYGAMGSQPVDAMGLYSQCRRTAGFRDKYTLDSVLEDEVGMGKLPLTSGSHAIMQRHHFKDYVVYNIFDVVGLRLLEDKNNDILTMHVLGGVTPVSRFATQTARATNTLYHSLFGKGQVLSSCSNEDSFVAYDKICPSVGGTVLPVDRVHGVGVKLNI